MSKSKSVLVISCTHVGHKGGLCGPDNWQSLETDDPKLLVVGTLQRQVYKFWTDQIVATRPDVVIHTGDIIDGPQYKSSGEDLWSTRQEDQAKAAIKLLRPFRQQRAKIFFCKGTRYHDPQNREQMIAEELHAECCEPQVFIDINGLLFDCKHQIGGGNVASSDPSIKNAMLANMLWNRRGGQPLADIIVRGHLHDFYHCGDASYTGIVVPGLQWYSEFGQLNVSRPISVGCVLFPNVEDWMMARDVSWIPLLAELPALAPRVFKA